MNKQYILIILLFVAGCKQIYDPTVDSNNGSIVINAVLTNNAETSKVTISKTTPYNPNSKQQFVSGAEVKIYDNVGLVYNLSETLTGVYTNPKLKAESGKTYYLEVISPEGDVYRSEAQSLPQKVTVDSAFGEIYTKKLTLQDLSGKYFQTDKEVVETYLDLRNNLPEVPKCRFEFKVTIVYEELKAAHSVLLWRTIKLPPDITTSTYELNTNKIKKHPLCYLYTDIYEYAIDSTAEKKTEFARICYILLVDKYDLNATVHQYYKDIKQQSEYTGKIFDPAPSQVKGNITCVNNPEKMAFGMFEVSNQEKLILKCQTYINDVTIIRKDSLKNYTESGMSEYTPDFIK
ncbi:MAG TPA: DUF4249 domain-containing protein [Bacteroidales bacterium]|nr:DUF4249 domain-containing protein [Bacteroidales bacterium]